MSNITLAGVEWQVDDEGVPFRVTASGEALMSVDRSHRNSPTSPCHWGVIETCKDARLMATRGTEYIETNAYPTQEAAAVAVLALARKRAAELLELAGGAL